MNLPHSGFLQPAPERRFEEVIVFVHHFGGSPESLSKHIQYVNELGFDAVAFQLQMASPKKMLRLPLTRNHKWGVSNVWEEQISDIFKAINRPKIVMSFSSPSGAALNAISEQPPGEIKGCICEGGPFAQVRRGYWNYFTHEIKIGNPIIRAGMANMVYYLLGGSSFVDAAKKRLKKLPQDFRILSIRAWSDRMVSIKAMDEYLKGSDHLAVEVLSLPEIDHLQGLSRAPEEYKLRVSKFLNSIGTKITEKVSTPPI